MYIMFNLRRVKKNVFNDNVVDYYTDAKDIHVVQITEKYYMQYALLLL